MADPLLVEICALGFSLAGVYNSESFEISPRWRNRQAVYLWTRETDAAEILRVGIACGTGGLGSRYDHYNRWLAGRFKPNDQREQKVRSLFLSKLDANCAVWAREVSGKQQALREEEELRKHWNTALHLDLMVPGSWAKSQMKIWRASQLALAAGPRGVAAKPKLPTASAPSLTALPIRSAPSLKELTSQLDAMLTSLGLAPSVLANGGVSYKLGRASLCRIDPKPSEGFLRVQVGEAAEISAPSALRGQYLQRGWLVVRPEDSDLARAYVSQCIASRLGIQNPV
jgi:hypothetical protein